MNKVSSSELILVETGGQQFLGEEYRLRPEKFATQVCHFFSAYTSMKQFNRLKLLQRLWNCPLYSRISTFTKYLKRT